MAIHSLSDILTAQRIETMLGKLSAQEIHDTFSRFLPSLSEKDDPEETVAQIVETGFFQLSIDRLSDSLREGEGSGLLLAQSFGLDYKGEGIDGFLQALRDKGKDI